MGLIVHLTDLHLGERGAARPADDAKVRVIPDQERTTVRDVALRHLKKLAKGIRDNGNTISALVLGGDFTVGALPGGYADLKPFLEDCFGDLLPKPPRIVATPGNHDVKWYATDPAERYEQFIEHCVKAGYVTPPLDGIDLKAAGRRWKPKAGNVLVNPEEGWFIVPLNTSNWSGTTAALVGADGKPIAEPINNVSVTITDLGSVSGPPAGYPADATGGSAIVPLDQWFHEVASWWQSELVEAPRGLFTHGRRLKLHRGEKGADQIAAMIEILDGPRRRGNGRAIATLIDAETDILGKGKGGPATFPAFCLLQLHVRPEGGRTLLDATAYFRKQEMRYWWPVNVAEIKLVMERVLTKMKDAELGAITTVAAVAAWQGIRSRVSIPYVDRLYLRDAAGREQLMEMAAVLGQQPFPGGTPTDLDRSRSLWELALDDVVPPENAVDDSIPIAVEGVRFLRQAVAAQGAAASDEALRKRLREAADHLGTLERNGEDLWELGRQPRDGRFQDKLARGVGAMTEARERLRAIIQEALPPAGPAADTKSGATS